MKSTLVAAAALLLALAAQVAQSQPAKPAGSEVATTSPANPVDTAVAATLKQRSATLAPQCSDEVFIRRVYIDIIGTLPEPQDVQVFVQDRRADKRTALIDTLLGRDEFNDYWALKWCDILRVKSEFPINLWPNAVQAYHHWIRDAISKDMPYDQFARELLTSSGSNFRTPPVNFYRAIQGRDPATIAKAVALTFMGSRIESWPQAKRADMANIFSRVAYKKTDEWKEEIVFLDPTATTPLKLVFPDGTTKTVPADQDPRHAFADWLLAPGNPWFTRSIVNRAWYWLMGHGVIHEPDDIRPDNPAASPELLACLEKEFVASHYDMRRLFRLILTSRTYQQTSGQGGDHPDPKTLFARYTVRRLDAEVLIDTLCRLGGEGESYSSAIPEPYTFIPKENRTIALADGSITSQFLETFGRPTRDSGLESERNNDPTDAQRLYLLSSADVQHKIQKSQRLRSLVMYARGNQVTVVRWLYLTVLSRSPTADEEAAAGKYFQTSGLDLGRGAEDLTWALVNTKEFLYRH